MTDYDASVWYGMRLADFHFNLTHASLCILLHIVQVPEFRDNMERPWFSPSFHEKVVVPRINIQSLCDNEYGFVFRSPQVYASYVKGIELEFPSISIQTVHPGEIKSGDPESEIKK
jgi:hypothetical protein